MKKQESLNIEQNVKTNLHEYSQQVIIAKKQRQKEYDEFVINLHIEERRKFYAHTIRQVLIDKPHMNEQKLQQIVEIFIEAEEKQDHLSIDFDKLGELLAYRQPIEQLKQIFLLMQKKWAIKAKECPPLIQALRTKPNSLKIIRIEYQSNTYRQEFYYSISAYALFRLIQDNKGIQQVTIRGVEIEQFAQFIKVMDPSNIHHLEHQKKELAWIRDYGYFKQTKVSIDAGLVFEIDFVQQVLSYCRHLLFFVNLFQSLSSIKVYIRIGYWSKIQQWSGAILSLWECLRTIKKIAIYIQRLQYDYFSRQLMPSVRSFLFGELTSFCEISVLSFRSIDFSEEVCVNDYQAIEQCLCIVFQNNPISFLEIRKCTMFPILPQSMNLQRIDLIDVVFRKQLMMNKVNANKKPFRQIKCEGQKLCRYQEWRINEKLLDQLQTLTIDNCPSIIFTTLPSLSFSPLKHLILSDESIGNEYYLHLIFPKLSQLTYLHLNNIPCGHQLISTIPSPHLEEIIFILNDQITDIGLQLIDQKWPLIKYITMAWCYALTSKNWSRCEFKGLIELKIQNRLFGNKDFPSSVRQLKMRGVKISQCY